MRVDLLEELANFLTDFKETEDTKFYLASWYHASRSCGTTACAMGWACTLPSFREAGFRLVGITSEHNLATRFHIEYGLHKNFGAVVVGLGIGSEAAEAMFSTGYYPTHGLTTAAEVAERIRSFLAFNKPNAVFSRVTNSWV